MGTPEPRAAALLRASVAAERWDRPFLLVGRGPDRDGAARATARAVLCRGRRPGSGDACGACGACHRFDRDLHPDFHLLAPAKNRVSIGVDAVEELQRALALRPVEGGNAAALVPAAEELTPQAQNALLKTLEEPPPRTALLLTVAAPRALLATVLSRCVVLRFPPPPRAEFAADAARRAGAAAAGGVLALGAAGDTAALGGWGGAPPRGGGRGRAAAPGGGGGGGAGGILAVGAAGDPAALVEAAEEGLAAAAPALARAFAPGAPRRDPLASLEPAAAWVKGQGSTLEDQRRRLRMALRLLLALHTGGTAGGGGLPAELAAPYAALTRRARDGRLAALGTARERVERNVDPGGILEALAVEGASADGS